MNDQELMEQFQRCKQWQDREQWQLLAVEYYRRGYLLNALHCFRQADACHGIAVTVETVAAAGER